MTKYVWQMPSGSSAIGEEPPEGVAFAEVPEDASPNDWFFDEATGTAQPVPVNTDPRARFDRAAGVWVHESTAAERMADQINLLKAHRWAVQTGGCDVPGLGRFHSDMDAVTNYTAAVQMFAAGLLSGTVRWTSLEGIMDLTETDLMAVAGCVALWVQDCRAAEETVIAQIPPADPMAADPVALFNAEMGL